MPEPFAYSIQDTCNAFGIGRTRIYELLSCGHLEGRKLGKKTLISASSLKAYFNGLPVAEVHVTPRETAILGEPARWKTNSWNMRRKGKGPLL